MTHFSGLPQNQINCGCQSLYSQNGATCQDICGDGFDVDPSTSYCDDGNVRSGDGCSSICQVETKYKCEKGSKTSRSICVYVGGPIKATLASITKSED
jgi:cysteine-rich repeat protein